jgi:uncharacterized protein GlcG (DUF336 family)
MPKHQTFWIVDDRDAEALVKTAREIALERIYDTTVSDCGPIAINVMPVSHDGGDPVAAATLRMVGLPFVVKSSDVDAANNKSLTALNYSTDTIVLQRWCERGSWTTIDVLTAQAARPYFTPLGGGVLGYKEGELVVAVSVAGLTPEGNDAVAREALHRCGYEVVDPSTVMLLQGARGVFEVTRTPEDMFDARSAQGRVDGSSDTI